MTYRLDLFTGTTPSASGDRAAPVPKGRVHLAIALLIALFTLSVAACSDASRAKPAPVRARAHAPAARVSGSPSPDRTSEVHRGREVYVAELGTSLSVLPSVFAPHRLNQPFRQFLVASDLSWAKEVLDLLRGIIRRCGNEKGGVAFLQTQQGPGLAAQEKGGHRHERASQEGAGGVKARVGDAG